MKCFEEITLVRCLFEISGTLSLKREEVDYNIRQKLYELTSLRAVFMPCDNDRQYTNSSTCEDDTY